MTTFDEGYYICEDCHEHLAREIIPYQAVYHKMKIQPTPLPWQCPWRREKLLISKQILFKKVVIIHTKGEFSKVKRSTCIASIETGRTCKVLLVLPRPEVSDEVIVVKLKGDVKWAHAIYDALNYLKRCNKFYEYITISKVLTSKEMLKYRSSGIRIRNRLVRKRTLNHLAKLASLTDQLG